MGIMGRANQPKTLTAFIEESESLWSVRSCLYDLCEDYNEFRQSANSYELKLLSETLEYVEEGIVQFCTAYTWENYDKTIIDSLLERVYSLDNLIKEIQSNVFNVIRGIENWGKEPFYYRKDKNPKELLDLQSRPEIVRSRNMECEKSRRQLGNAIEKNRQLFEVGGSDSHKKELFDDYLKFVDSEVLSCVKWAVYQNLLNLNHEMKRPSTEPLFEIRVLERNREIAFSPSLEDPLDMLSQKSESFIYQIEMIIGDICSMADIIPRVAPEKKMSFLTELREDEDIGDVKREIRMSVIKAIKNIKLYVRKLDKFMFLWTNNQENITNHAEEPKVNEFRENVRTRRIHLLSFHISTRIHTHTSLIINRHKPELLI